MPHAFVSLIVIGCAVAGAWQATATRVIATPSETEVEILLARPVPRDVTALAAAFRGVSPQRVIVDDQASPRRVGEQQSFWIQQTRPPRHVSVPAELRIVGRHAYWFVADGYVVTEAALAESARVFDSVIYPQVRRLMGSERFPGVDNDPRITIFNGELPGLAGYVTSADGHARAAHPFSNQSEMIYVSLAALQPATLEYYATVAHELTHLVHANMNPSEDTWVKEGLAELVASLVFPERGLSYQALEASPDVPLTAWFGESAASHATSAHYEASSQFFAFLADQFGEAIISRIAMSPIRGGQGLDRVLASMGSAMEFREVFASWTSAAVTRTGLHPDRPMRPFIKKLDSGAVHQGSAHQFGARYFELPLGTRSASVESQAHVPLIGASPSKGERMWYAGRSDGSAALLTRVFDLTEAPSATLSFDVWHDTEPEYDFAYVSASVDGGESWTNLKSDAMTSTQTTGENLGWGFSGPSKRDGPGPQWIAQNLDLSSFVGTTVEIQFSYVTDDAVARRGVAIDNIRLDAASFEDGAETADAGWVARGWSRVGTDLPQSWSINLLQRIDGAWRVAALSPNEAGRTHWVAPIGEPSPSQIILSVSPTNSLTLAEADFVIRLFE